MPLLTTWKTDNPGVSNDSQIKLFVEGNDYLIDWQEVGNDIEFWQRSGQRYAYP
jgi:hypothetical protein